MPTPRRRVAAYVIRHRAGPELLVFDHLDIPDAGTQIPAGGIRADEDPHTAVLREVTEETGLDLCPVIGAVGIDHRPHPITGQPRHTHVLHLHAPEDDHDSWIHTVRGTDTDAGLQFACRFVSLPLSGSLADEQDLFLGRLDPDWTTLTRR
ncbi:NUDIX domain-containing protein [Rhodococcus artemisiae]|uniref:NUDIX domain-containing protein n=1 Tax=Rhodococcus artemisiae TaxID=714159 RepID=A0ABU7L376_9NOCA|nr:NUDIX domain-containing protein [Rhodococcus artemisiae]MEE2055997.1 NUDIX domain-containing protein [Rhodococcus artemisiae]